MQFIENHARAAPAALVHYIHQQKIDVVLVQDPYLEEGRLHGFSNLWKKFPSKDRSAWIDLTSITYMYTALPAKLFSTYIVLKTNDGPLTIGSQ